MSWGFSIAVMPWRRLSGQEGESAYAGSNYWIYDRYVPILPGHPDSKLLGYYSWLVRGPLR